MSAIHSDGSMIVVDHVVVNDTLDDSQANGSECKHDEGYSLNKDNYGEDIFQRKRCDFFTSNKGGMKTHQTRIHKVIKPQTNNKRAFDHEEDKLEHVDCLENDHNQEKKIRQDFLDSPQSTQKDDQFDEIINAANNLTEIDYEDFKLSEETYDNLSNLDCDEIDEDNEIDTTVINLHESLQS